MKTRSAEETFNPPVSAKGRLSDSDSVSLPALKKIEREFYLRNVLDVAAELPGKIFVKKSKDNQLLARIVEVEAYSQINDKASHSFRGETNRNRVMFLLGGHLYVYFTYGMHFCANVVTGQVGQGNAVLIRAAEPVYGIEEMILNRFGKSAVSQNKMTALTSGPAKFCQSFGIVQTDNGIDLCGRSCYIAGDQFSNDIDISVSRRIGIKKSVSLPWRFYIKGNPYLSRK